MRHDAVLSPVRLCLTGLHTLAGCLFLARAPERVAGSAGAMARALPSILCAGMAFRLAPPPHLWPPVAVGLFVGGSLWTVLSLGTLGRSFAVLPSRRALVTRGPYRLVRHPAYAGELLLVAASALASGRPEALVLVALTLPALGLRIAAEEAVLAGDEAHARYREAVPHRLLPGVW